MITQKNISRLDITQLSQTFPVKEIQKKRDCARGMRVFRARKTRARTREPAEMAMMTIHNITSFHDKSKYDLKKPSEPEEKERGRERFFFVSLCPRESSFWIQRERERERERERKKRELRR